MFVIIDERLVWWKARFRAADAEGAIVEHEIELQFVILDEADFPKFAQKFVTPANASAEPSVAAIGQRFDTSVNALLEVVRGWRGVMDANGEPLPFTPENFRRLMKVPLVMAAVGNAYIACRQAAPEAREGN